MTPEPLTEVEEAEIRAQPFRPGGLTQRLLATLDATRTALAQAQGELQAVTEFRSDQLDAIRNLIGEEGEDDEALMGSACAIIVTWKELAKRKKAAEAALGQMQARLDLRTAENDHMLAANAQLDADLAAARAEAEAWKAERDAIVGGSASHTIATLTVERDTARAAQEAAERADRANIVRLQEMVEEQAEWKNRALAAEATVGGLREALKSTSRPMAPDLVTGEPRYCWCDSSSGWSCGKQPVCIERNRALATPAPIGENPP